MAHCDLFKAGEIACIIGDDADHGSHSTQYSGLWTLISDYERHSAFVPAYAGCIADEHRRTQPKFERLSELEAELYHAPTKEHPSESWGRFRLVEPHYIDYEFRFVDKEDLRQPDCDFRELVWCSYINSPEDPHIHFISDGKWAHILSPKHGVQSCYGPACLKPEQLERLPVEEYKKAGRSLPFRWSYGKERFDLPFYYGRIREMALIFMFDKFEEMRFFMSPSGGGRSILPGQANPAWDWCWIIRNGNYQVGETYQIRLRIAYKKFISEEDVLQEYQRFKEQL